MIELHQLTKDFHGAAGPVRVLDGVSLTVRAGEIFGIIGRSGAGKSTLVRCVNLLERPTSGRVVVGGQELTGLEGAALRRARHAIGMIFQHFNLLSSRTALDNAALPLELAGASRAAARAAAAPLLALVGLAGKEGRYPAELSGGEKQRVGIARALASKPQVLLCDEATSALDPETTRAILALLRDINRQLGLTIVLITHEMQVVKEIAQRVAVLDRGRVLEEGTVFDVFTTPATEVARAFVRDVVDRELPPGLAGRLAPPGQAGGALVVRIVFTGPSAHEPIVAEAVRRFGILLNILHGSIDSIQGEAYGHLLVEARGPAEDVQAALDWIRGANLKVEVIGHVVGDARAVA
jgi:D-methionine transport system ATP-binding protein